MLVLAIPASGTPAASGYQSYTAMRKVFVLAVILVAIVRFIGAFVDGATGIVKASEANTKAAVEAAER